MVNSFQLEAKGGEGKGREGKGGTVLESFNQLLSFLLLIVIEAETHGCDSHQTATAVRQTGDGETSLVSYAQSGD